MVAGAHPGGAPLTGTAAPIGIRPPALVWVRRNALLGLVVSVPAVVATAGDVRRGLALAFGVLPAMLIGVLPRRRDRVRVVPVGVLMALSILLGSLVANLHVVACVAIFGLALGAALLFARAPIGALVLNLAVPMVGIGLSFTDHATGLGVTLLIIGGTLYSYLVSLLWPEWRPAPRAPASRPGRAAMRDYGVRLGLAGSLAAALAFGFGLDHPGWQVAAALLVMRPVAEMQRLRSIGRIVSVTLGAFLAAALAAASPAWGWYAIGIVGAIVAAAGTVGSRWYVTPLFTTFIAISLLLYARPQDVGYRFTQRVLETLVGVGVAYLFGLVVPTVRARWRPLPPQVPNRGSA